jgi:hypothetical protein
MEQAIEDEAEAADAPYVPPLAEYEYNQRVSW